MRRLIVTSYCDVSVFAHSSQRDEDIACRPPSLSDRVSVSLALIQDVRNDLRNAKLLCAVDSLHGAQSSVLVKQFKIHLLQVFRSPITFRSTF